MFSINDDGGVLEHSFLVFLVRRKVGRKDEYRRLGRKGVNGGEQGDDESCNAAGKGHKAVDEGRNVEDGYSVLTGIVTRFPVVSPSVTPSPVTLLIT